MQLENQRDRTDKAYEAAVAIAAAIHAGYQANGSVPSVKHANEIATEAAWDLMSRFYGE